MLSMAGYYAPDTTTFLAEGKAVGEWNAHTVPPLSPTLLDALIKVVPNPSFRFPILVFTQHVGVVLAIGMITGIVSRLGSPRLGLIAGLLCAVNPHHYFFAQTSQTEALFITLAIASVYCLVRAGGDTSNLRSKLLWGLFAGIMAGLAMNQRTTGLALPACLAIALILSFRTDRMRALAAPALLLTIGFSAMVGLAKWRNELYHGRSNFVDGRGIHLLNRASQSADDLTDSAACEQLREFANAAGHERVLWDYAGWPIHAAAMEQGGLDRIAADELLFRAAIDTMAANPAGTIRSTWDLIQSDLKELPPNFALLWTGVHPEAGRAHALIGETTWDDSETVRRMMAELPPHRAPEILGRWAPDALLWWSYSGLLWRGPGLFFWAVIFAVINLVYRDPLSLWIAGIGLSLIIIPSLTEIAQTRFWDVCVPFFVMSGLLAFRRLRRSEEQLRMTNNLSGEEVLA